MADEFKKRVEALKLDEESQRKVIDLILEAGKEFPCLACSSKDDCENFNWYKKWFNE